MPILTETLHNSKKVHQCLKKRNNYLPTHHHHRITMPNVLGDRVSETKPRIKPKICQDEMHKMMACWKHHGFKEGTCGDELKIFDACVKVAKERAAERKNIYETAELGKTTRLNPKSMNQLFRMYPQPMYKVNITHAHGKEKKKPLVLTGVNREYGFQK